MNAHMILTDLAWMLVLVTFYAAGHYHGRVDTLRALKRTGYITPGATPPIPRGLIAMALLALVLLMFRWAGVLA